VTHVFEGVKLGLRSTSQPFIGRAALARKGLGCANDNGPDTQELHKREVNLSRPAESEAAAGSAMVPSTVT
jgi:hypothetical protein